MVPSMSTILKGLTTLLSWQVVSSSAMSSPLTSCTPFRVNTETGLIQSNPDIAVLPSGDFSVVWESSSGVESEVMGQLYDSDLGLIGNEFRVNDVVQGSQSSPQVAVLTDDQYVAIWIQSDDNPRTLRMRRYSDSNNISGPVEISGVNPNTLQSPSIVRLGEDEFLVTYSVLTGSNELYTQRFNSSLMPIESAFRVEPSDDGNENFPSVTRLSNGGYAVVYSSGGFSGGDGDQSGVFMNSYSATSNLTSGPFLVNDTTEGGQTEPAIARLTNGDVVVVWRNSAGLPIRAKHYDENLMERFPEFNVNQLAAVNEREPCVTPLHDGGYVVAWTSQVPGAFEVTLRRFNSQSLPITGDIIVGNNIGLSRTGPLLATTPDGHIIVIWESAGATDADIYGQLMLVDIENTNQSPVLQVTIQEQMILPFQPYSYTLLPGLFTDAEVNLGCQNISYSIATPPNWLSFDPETLTFSGFPSTFDQRISDIFLQASDGIATSLTSFQLTINSLPQAVASFADQDIYIDELMSYQLPDDVLVDPDDDPLIYMVNSLQIVQDEIQEFPLPSWLSFNSQDRTFIGTPPADTVGNEINVRVTAADNISPDENVTQSFSFNVISRALESGDSASNGNDDDSDLTVGVATAGAVIGAGFVGLGCFFGLRAYKKSQKNISQSGHNQLNPVREEAEINIHDPYDYEI